MAAYVIVQITIRDPDAYARYRELAPPSIAHYDGRYLVRGAPTHALEGAWDPGRLVILEFPDVDRARAWWASPEYAEARALRQECAESAMIVVAGV